MSMLCRAWAIAALMVVASVGAVMLRPGERVADQYAHRPLDSIVPRTFAGWRESSQRIEVVDPQRQELLDRIYSQVLSRVYVDAEGNHMMLSLAYGSDQRRSLQAHKPEVCYPAQGFTVHANDAGFVATRFGDIPVRRLRTALGARLEQVTYWFTVGDTAVGSTMQKRLVDLRFGLTGQIPDGLIFRVSSIDADATRAFALQIRFIDELLVAMEPQDRARLSGLGRP